MSVEWASVIISLTSVIVGACISLVVTLLNAKNAKLADLHSEQRRVILQLSGLTGSILALLDITEQIAKLQQFDVLGQKIEEFRESQKRLNQYYQENKILLPDDLRKWYDKLLQIYGGVSAHTYLATYVSNGYVFIVEEDDKRNEYFEHLKSSMKNVKELSSKIESIMRHHIGVSK